MDSALSMIRGNSETKPRSNICHLSDRRNGVDGRSSGAQIDLGVADIANVPDVPDVANLAVGCLLRAITGDMASLTALVAGLASSVERAAVGGGAIPRNMSKLAAGIALHGLSLAVPSKVVGATALVAGGRARAAGKTTTSIATKATTADRGSTPTKTNTGRVGAGALWAC